MRGHHVGITLIVAAGLCFGCKDQDKRDECKAFSDWSNKTPVAIQSTVPEAERMAAKAPEEFAAWYRKLAKAYAEESKKPLQFRHADVRPLEERMRASWGKTADVLERTADAWVNDRPKVKELQLEDGKVNQERDAIVKDWLTICSK